MAFAQDSTKSVVLKDNQPVRKKKIIKAKYPSYQLLNGFILVKEANEGDPFAQQELGSRYLIGKGFQPDTVKAISWLKKAVDQELPQAIYNYAILYFNGIGFEWNPFEAYRLFKKSAFNNLAQGKYAYGVLLTENLIVNRNYSEAYKWIKNSAEMGFEPAEDALKQFEKMGMKFDESSTDSTINQQNPEESFALLNQDWELDLFSFDDSLDEKKVNENILNLFSENIPDLKNTLGVKEIKDTLNLVDTTNAIQIINYAADNGSPEALMIKGRNYEAGLVNKKNRIKALANYIRAFRLGSRKAAEYTLKLTRDQSVFDELKEEVDDGNPEAMYAWAGLIALGFDYRLTDEQAVELLEDAVEEDHVPSIIEKGLCYYNGTLVEQDKEKSIEYWEKAVKLGSKEAEIRIIFDKINNIEEYDNLDDEINVLEKYADEGSVLAQAVLAYCYEKGLGVATDKAKASQLYRQAAARGNEAAWNSLKKMYDDLRPDETEFVIFEE